MECDKYFWSDYYGGELKLFFVDDKGVVRYEIKDEFDSDEYWDNRHYGKGNFGHRIKESLIEKITSLGYKYVEQRNYSPHTRVEDFCTHVDNTRTYDDIINLLAKRYVSSRTHKVVVLEPVGNGFKPKIEIRYGKKTLPYNVDAVGIMHTPRLYSITNGFYDVYFSYISNKTNDELKEYIISHKKEIYEDVYRILMNKRVDINMIKPSQIVIKKSTSEVLVQMQDKCRL